jgi:hypothetical protein
MPLAGALADTGKSQWTPDDAGKLRRLVMEYGTALRDRLSIAVFTYKVYCGRNDGYIRDQ